MSFAQGFDKWARHVNLSMDQATRAIVLDTATRIGMRSPIRDGMFLANHNVSVGSVDRSTVDGTTRNRSAAAEKARGVSMRLGDVIYISNSLPYARRLEYDAWSAQAAGGVYRLAALDTRNQIKSIIKQAGL